MSGTYPIFPTHSIPMGRLPNVPAAQACWYFYTIAHTMYEKVGRGIEDQILIEGEMWRTKRYAEQKKGVAMMFGLESPAEFDKFWPKVQQEVARCRFNDWMLPIPLEEYMNADMDRKSYNDG